MLLGARSETGGNVYILSAGFGATILIVSERKNESNCWRGKCGTEVRSTGIDE
jgi:hypothetical protein